MILQFDGTFSQIRNFKVKKKGVLSKRKKTVTFNMIFIFYNLLNYKTHIGGFKIN